MLHVTRITWTPRCVGDDFLRLYGLGPTGSTADEPVSKRSQAVGDGPFMPRVVEDPAPVYVYDDDKVAAGMLAGFLVSRDYR